MVDYTQAVNWKEARKTGKHGIGFTFDLDEGKVTAHKGTRSTGDSEFFTFASELYKKDYVTLSGNMLVKKPTANTDIIIGQLITNPQWPEAEPEKGDTNYGTAFDYKINGEQAYRMGSIELFGTSIRRVETDAAIDIGKYVEYKPTTGKFVAVGENKTSNCIVIEAATAANKKAVVLFGFKPVN